jgi:hypothetical protein
MNDIISTIRVGRYMGASGGGGSVGSCDCAPDPRLDAHLGDTVRHISGGERETWNNKQDRLIAGDNITITGNVISSGNINIGDGRNQLIYLGQIDKTNPTEQELNGFAETEALSLFGNSTLKTGYTIRDANDFDWRYIDEAYIPVLKFAVSGSVTGNGNLTGLGEYFAGETVTITASPTNGNELKSLLVDGTQRTSPYTFTMPKLDVSVTAVFGAVSVPVKSIGVGNQTGTAIAGNATTVTYAVSTQNIANGTYTPTVTGLPAGVTVSGNVTISNNGGTLTLAVANTASKGTTSITLTIDNTQSAAFNVVITQPAISIGTQPNATTNVTQGSISGALSVTASSDSTSSTLSYQWYSNNSNSNSNGTIINGATSASYTIPATLTAGSYYYYCIVSGNKGEVNVTSNVGVVVVAALAKTVSVGSQSGTITAGAAGSTTFTVTTSNIANGSYNVSVANLPANVSAGAVTINNNTGTLTLTATANAQASVTSTLTLTIDGVTSSAFTLTIAAAQPAGRVEVLIGNQQQQEVTLTSAMITNGIRLLSGATFTSAHKLSGFNVTGSNYTTSYKHSTSSSWSTPSSGNWVGLTAEEIRGGQYMDINFTGSPATIVVQSYGW